MNILRKIQCFFQLCPHKPASDETGCWGECVHCGKRAGFVDRDTLRRYADAEIRREFEKRGEQEP